MTLTDYITGHHPLPFTRQHRQMKARRRMLDLAARYLFPHEEVNIPMARDAARAAADWHTSAMVDAMLSDPLLKIEFVG